MNRFSKRTEEAERQSEWIQKKADKIFELARTNNWDIEQFGNKILAGAIEFDLGYFALGAQLVQNVTGLEGRFAIEILKFLLVKVKELDTVKIKQTQEIFFEGLIINKLKAHQEYQQQQQQQQQR